MADNELTVVRATGETKTLRSRDVGSQVQAQLIDVSPWMPTVVAGAQYNQTVSNSVFTLTVPSTATHVLLSIDGADIRFTEDSSSPSATNGMILKDGTIIELALPNPLKLIRAAAIDAKLNAAYRKYI